MSIFWQENAWNRVNIMLKLELKYGEITHFQLRMKTLLVLDKASKVKDMTKEYETTYQ